VMKSGVTIGIEKVGTECPELPFKSVVPKMALCGVSTDTIRFFHGMVIAGNPSLEPPNESALDPTVMSGFAMLVMRSSTGIKALGANQMVLAERSQSAKMGLFFVAIRMTKPGSRGEDPTADGNLSIKDS